MSYKNGTYIAFHANGTSFPINSDIKYYNLLKAWKIKADSEFHFINSHEKTSGVRDTSTKETLRRSLVTRLRNSKNLLLIIGETTKHDDDWVPFEISYAIDECKIPIIATYINYSRISSPNQLSYLWPNALKERIKQQNAHVIHIPFKKEPIADAISQFNHNKYPLGGGLGIYSYEAYRKWGLL